MKYRVKDKSNFFIKDHGKKVSVIFVKDTQRHFFINDTGKLIFDICDQYTDTRDLVEYLKSLYINVDEKSINDDVIDILRLLEIYKVVEFIDDNYVDTNEDVFVVGDREYKIVSNYIISNLKNKKNIWIPLQIKEYYETPSMRQRVMTNQEYYIAFQKNSQIIGMVSFIPPAAGNSVLSINSYLFDSKLSDEDSRTLINKAIDKIVKVLQNKITKIRVSLVLSNSINNSILDYFLNNNFKIEATLKNEYLDNDLVLIFKVL